MKYFSPNAVRKQKKNLNMLMYFISILPATINKLTTAFQAIWLLMSYTSTFGQSPTKMGIILFNIMQNQKFDKCIPRRYINILPMRS